MLQHHGHVRQHVDDFFISNCKRGEDQRTAIDEHITRIDDVFSTLAEANVKLSPGKLDLMQLSIEALGHTICNHTITVSKKKTAAVRDIAPPKTNKQLASAMGILGLARRFMPDFATAAMPLCQLLATDHRKFSWLPEHQTAMDRIKQRFEDGRRSGRSQLRSTVRGATATGISAIVELILQHKANAAGPKLLDHSFP